MYTKGESSFGGCSVTASTRVLGTCRGVRLPHLPPKNRRVGDLMLVEEAAKKLRHEYTNFTVGTPTE